MATGQLVGVKRDEVHVYAELHLERKKYSLSLCNCSCGCGWIKWNSVVKVVFRVCCTCSIFGDGNFFVVAVPSFLRSNSDASGCPWYYVCPRPQLERNRFTELSMCLWSQHLYNSLSSNPLTMWGKGKTSLKKEEIQVMCPTEGLRCCILWCLKSEWKEKQSKSLMQQKF